MAIQMEADFTFIPGGDSARDLNEFLDQVYDHLTENLVCGPVNIVSDGAAEFTILLTTDEQDGELPEAAAHRAVSTIRTAFHAVGVSTKNWPTAPRLTSSSFSEVQLVH